MSALLYEFRSAPHWTKKMRYLLAVLTFTIFCLGCAEENKVLDLSNIDQVGVWELSVSGLNEKEKVIKDTGTILEIVSLLEDSDLNWERVKYHTAPSGSVRLIFYSKGEMKEALGIGDDFIVEGTGGDWNTTQINRELGKKIRDLVSKALSLNIKVQQNQWSCRDKSEVLGRIEVKFGN